MLGRSFSSRSTGVYNPKTFILHAALRRQACAHCEQFPTAASRRSLGRVSVPVWPVALSGRLPVDALVGHHPTNKLIGRGPIPSRKKLSTTHHAADNEYPVLAPVSRSYPEAEGRLPTCYSPVRHSSTPKGLSVRLACVKHAASVRPEPGSNSPSNAYNQTPKGPQSTKRKPEPQTSQTDPFKIQHQTTHPTKQGRQSGKQHQTKTFGTDYRYAVEFSKNGHAPLMALRTSQGQNLN